MTLYGPFNSSPQLHATPYSLASSHGSSFGSYGENCALGSSFGSYGDGTGMSVSYPATLNGQMSLLGGSPDARRLSAPHMQGLGQGLGHTQLGMSPSGGGRPLSLGGSPSHQFSAPGPPHFQTSPGSQYAASPGSQYQTSSGTFGLHFACWQVLFCWLSSKVCVECTVVHSLQACHSVHIEVAEVCWVSV